jgi:transcriptional regulator with XRE-family HTH domain
VTLGELIRDLRLRKGWSQDRLAQELRDHTRTTITQTYVSQWELGKKHPRSYWLRQLAEVLAVPISVFQDHLEDENAVKRRTLLLGATAALLASPAGEVGGKITQSIASGDSGPLADVQTTHQTDCAISHLVAMDRASLMHLRRWSDDGDTVFLRVNAAGILAKTKQEDASDQAALVLGRDADVRQLYLTAVTHRVLGISWQAAGHYDPRQATERELAALRQELENPNDSGARWCAAVLLAQTTPSVPTVHALSTALRREPSRETLRTIGMALTGETPWS